MEQKASYPKGIPYIIGNEAAERFSFYGMKAILTTFLVSQFFNPTNNPALEVVSNAEANNITHLFNTLVYLLPLAGAILADWFYGKYKVILYLSLVYCAGHACLALFENNLNGFLAGLLLISIGSGGIKPCVSANVGDQFDESNKSLLSKAYSMFYFSINAGSFISMLLTPVILRYSSPAVAFGVPGILMGIATLLFFLGRKKYVHVPPSGIKKDNFISVSLYAFVHFRKKTGGSLLDVAKEKYSPESVEAVKVVWQIIAVFSVIPIFWALNDQNSSEWVLQARNLDLSFMGYTFLPEQVQSANAILVLIYIPLFNYVIFPFLEKRNIRLSPYKKIGIGFIFTLLSFGIIYWLQLSIDKGGAPNVGWQLLAYIIITAGEVLVYQTGLEYAYTKAPVSMKSTIMAFWLLTISLGNLIVSGINNSIAHKGLFSVLEGSRYYLFYIALMGITIVVYYFLSKTFDRKKQ